MSNDEKPKRQVKFLLTDKDQHVVRLAAAMNQMTMAEYCREVVLQDARELTKDIKLPIARSKRKPSGSG